MKVKSILRLIFGVNLGVYDCGGFGFKLASLSVPLKDGLAWFGLLVLRSVLWDCRWAGGAICRYH